MENIETPTLSSVFDRDVQTLAADFIKEFDLKYDKKDPGLSNPLLRWLDFTSRYISPRPRRVLYSNCVAKAIRQENKAAFKRIVSLIKNGADLNPYQSKGLTLHNDTSGKSKQKRTDQLWAHWGIHHLHLTTARPQQNQYFSGRSSWLLFCIVGDDFIGIVDVRHHDEADLFSDPELIKTVVRSWPDLMERYRLKNVIEVSGGDRSASEIATSRKATLNTPIEVDQQFYFVPGGITTAATPIDVTNKFLQINRLVEQLGAELSDANSLWRSAFTADNPEQIDLHVALHTQGLGVFDRRSDRITLLPRSKDEPGNPYARLHDLLLPKWAHGFLMRAQTA